MNVSDLRGFWAVTNVQAMSRVVREKESNQRDDAYTIINGGSHFTPPARYEDWRHPWHGIPTTQGAKACGAYQHLGTTWAGLAKKYGIPDFSPPSQDLGFVGGLIERGALDDVVCGRFDEAVAKLRKEWTSLPGASESRPDWTLDKARALFVRYGGALAGPNVKPQPVPIGTPTKGAEVDPLTLSLVGMAAKLIPDVMKIFGGKEPSEVATRNIAAAQRVADVVIEATGASGPGDAMDKLPAKVEEVKAAVRADPALGMLVEVGGGVAAARKSNEDYMARLEDDEWWRMLLKLVANPALVVSACGFYIVHIFVVELAKQINKVSPDVVSGAMQSTISLILGAIFGFWLGQTWQQRKEQ